MEIEGEYSFAAPRELVWSLLHDPGVIQQAVPGCEQFYQQSNGAYRLILNVAGGPFDGRYDGTINLEAAEPLRTFSLSLRGSGPQSVLSGEGTFSLSEEKDHTKLHYRGEVEVAGSVTAQSPRLVRTTANSLIRRYLEAINRQACELTGTASHNGLPPLEPLDTARKRSTIGMQDWLAEIRRDRRVAVILLILAFLVALSGLGAVFVGLLVARWAARASANRLARVADKRGGSLPEERP